MASAVTQIITDSTCAFPPDMNPAHRAHVRVLRTAVHVGGASFTEGTFSLDEIYQRVEQNGGQVRTSQPAPEEYLRLYREVAPRGPILAILLSGALSGTLASALALAGEVTEADIEVFDSHFFSSALGYMVAEATEMALAGVDREAIMARLRWRRAHTSLFIAVDKLDYLRRSGRVNVFQAGLATMLDIKPILGAREGRLEVVGRVRTRRRSLERLLALIEGSVARLAGPFWISAMHGRAAAEAEWLLQEMERSLPVERSFISEAPASVALHGGPGVVGVMVTPASAGSEAPGRSRA